MTASRSNRRFLSAGWRATPWLLVLSVMLKSSVPMLAAAAAQLRGVGVAEVCPVYGVAVPAQSTHDMVSAHGAMAAMGDTGAVEHQHGGPHADHAAHTAHQGDHPHDHHDHLASEHDHCALTPLLAAAALAAAPAPIVGALPRAAPLPASPPSAAPLHDATLAWYARDAHPPPG